MSNISTIKQFTVSVRALADFCQNQGDLVSTYRPTPSAFEGQATHKLIQQKRPSDYQKEVSLSALWQSELFELKISGRADGVTPHEIEEIKTTRIPPNEIPESVKALHLQQAKIYGALYLLTHDAKAPFAITVTYVHPQTLQEWPTTVTLSRFELVENFISLCTQYDQWLTQLAKHQNTRQQFIQDMDFPFAHMRASQRQMAENVYKACCTKKHLSVEAPTGTGKTLASLFPALKAAGKTNIQSLFFLTMKTTGKVAALEALRKLDCEQQLNSVFLSAKTRVCMKPDSVCDGQLCEYAENYYGKRAKVRSKLFEQQHWHEEALIKLAHEESICPYYLSQDWAIWSDIIVGDVNYIYDTTAVQPYLLKEINNQAIVLIDESHNLIDRGRMMFSANFNGQVLQFLIKNSPKAIQKSLRKIQKSLRELTAEHNGQLSQELPTKLIQALRDFVAYSATLLRENPSFEPDENWQQFIFQCTRFTRLHELANIEDFRWRYQDGSPDVRSIELICLNPSPLLKNKHDLVNNVVAFSATLKPWHYSNQLNGLAEAVVTELPSPFKKSQHQVYIANDVSTRYRDRQNLPEKLRATLQKVIDDDKNSMVFFSSYQQLKQCTDLLSFNEKTLSQQANWDADDRESVLQKFRNDQGLTLFTVLGGVFSEGIDLPGKQLETTLIIGPGLPQVNEVNDAIKSRMQSQGFSGFEFAYVFPGLQKVLQAAGRCVRTEEDQGNILLIDDRFIEYQQKGWLPDFWDIQTGQLQKWQPNVNQ